MISASDLKREFKERLEAVGLWNKLDLRESQFLDLPPQVFVELVLHDAGVAERIADVAGDIRAAHRDEEIDIVIRANWKIRSVLYAGHALGLSGGVRAAERFDVVIMSGDETRKVTIDVLKDAVDLLKSKLLPGMAYEQVVKELVQKFVEMELAQGGTSYWDPVRHPHLDVNAAAVQYMIGHELFKILA
jgi:hypothetical protein